MSYQNLAKVPPPLKLRRTGPPPPSVGCITNGVEAGLVVREGPANGSSKLP
jgi:hypothetical protein